MTSSDHQAITCLDWPVAGVKALTTNRLGALSQAKFGSFNLGLHVGDEAEQVLANRQSLNNYFGEQARIQWLEQVHGSDVHCLEKWQPEPIVADAIVTSKANIGLAIMTADCLPILLSSDDGNIIAAIHGGWRPLASNIIEKTIVQMNVKRESVQVWLGPCIGPTAFEVGQEVKDAFTVQNEMYLNAFKPLHDDKYLADLAKIATLKLNHLGIANISQLANCTYSDTQRYYSYRKEGQTGRMASVIMIE